MAILRHETPDGAAHFDLLLADMARVPDDARTVPTWRCERDPFTLAPGERMRVEAIAPHRGFYLRLEGEHALDGARGRVRSVRRGWHSMHGGWMRLHDPHHGHATIRFEGDRLIAGDAVPHVNAS